MLQREEEGGMAGSVTSDFMSYTANNPADPAIGAAQAQAPSLVPYF